MSLPLLVDAVKNGTGRGVAQTGEVSYAKKISAQEMQINWGLTALEIDRLIRVGGAYTNIGDKRLKIIAAKISSDTDTTHVVGAISLISRNQCEIRTGAGSISLVEVQPEGKSVMSVAGWLNGARIEPGAVFG
jgi:methionyl-tRNA formyltransferase